MILEFINRLADLNQNSRYSRSPVGHLCQPSLSLQQLLPLKVSLQRCGRKKLLIRGIFIPLVQHSQETPLPTASCSHVLFLERGSEAMLRASHTDALRHPREGVLESMVMGILSQLHILIDGIDTHRMGRGCFGGTLGDIVKAV